MKDITFLTVNSKGKVENKISRHKMTVAGKEKLAHEVAKTLLTSPGSSEFNSEYGSGLASLEGYLFEDDDDARSQVISMIKASERSIQNNQTGTDLPPLEKLKSIELGDVSVEQGQVLMDLYIVNLLGVAYNINYEVD